MITNLENVIGSIYNSMLNMDARIYLSRDLDEDECLTLHKSNGISISIKDFKDIFEEDFTNRSKFLYTVKEGSNKFVLINDGTLVNTFKNFTMYINYVLNHKNHITLDDFYLSLASEVRIIADDVIKYLAFKVENIDIKETAVNNLEILIKILSEFKCDSKVKTKIIYDEDKLLLKIVEDPSNIVSHITKDNEGIIFRNLINNKWWATRNEFITSIVG